MTKRIIAILFTLVLILSVALVPAGAATEVTYRLDDNANLLSDSEENALNATLYEVAAKCKCNVVFVTANDLNGATFSHNGTTADYADMYYETVCGQNTDGVLVLVVLSNENGKRETYFSTSGKCIKRLSDSERESILDDLQYNHHPDTAGYYDMLNAAAVDLAKEIPPHVKWYMLPLSFLIGFIIAMIFLSIKKKQLTTVAMQRGAVNYVRPGSMNVTAARDTYLYSTTSRTARPKDSGGSSSHTSSGGGTHGGGGRSF